MKAQPDLSRRRLLVTGSGALAAAGLVGVSRVAAQAAPQAPPLRRRHPPLRRRRSRFPRTWPGRTPTA